MSSGNSGQFLTLANFPVFLVKDKTILLGKEDFRLWKQQHMLEKCYLKRQSKETDVCFEGKNKYGMAFLVPKYIDIISVKNLFVHFSCTVNHLICWSALEEEFPVWGRKLVPMQDRVCRKRFFISWKQAQINLANNEMSAVNRKTSRSNFHTSMKWYLKLIKWKMFEFIRLQGQKREHNANETIGRKQSRRNMENFVCIQEGKETYLKIL